MSDRRFLPALLVAIAAFFVALVPAQAQITPKSHLFRIQESGKLRVGTTGDFNPMSFRDPNTKELRGHQIDVAKKLAEDLGVQVEYVPTDWKTLVSGIASDQFDIVLTGTSMSVARAKVVAFSDPWGFNAFVPLVRKADAAKYKDWDDLNRPEVSVGFNLGTTFEQFVQQDLPKATPRRVESPARDWQELLTGRVDVTITSLIEAAFLTKEYPDLVVLFPDRPRNSIPMAFITAIDDPIWLNFVNNWLAIRKASGFFTRIAAEWRIANQ